MKNLGQVVEIFVKKLTPLVNVKMAIVQTKSSIRILKIQDFDNSTPKKKK